MKLSYDPEKRRRTLVERGVDFEDVALVFAGLHFTRPDLRRDYGEDRFISTGMLRDRLVICVWTPRDGGRRIISMRKADDDEQEEFAQRLG